jgi:cellulose synthase (UDP-forming)
MSTLSSVPLYQGVSTATGPLQPASTTMAYRRVFTRSDNIKLALLGIGHALIVAAFITYLVMPQHLPLLRSWHSTSIIYDVGAIIGSSLIILLQFIQLLQTVSVSHYASRCKDPIPMVPQPGLRVAMLTTIVPSKEPWEIAQRTLLKFKDQIHDGIVDAWVLDEEDDPYVKARCAELGINHFSRKGVPEWNQVTGPYRARTKHGNHNAWRSVHESKYDVVTQMDPDHCPLDSNDFLLRILGYFNDPDVAFVVAPQVYGNSRDNFVARGAAQLTYVFHGTIQRGCNGLGAPVLIGTNHAFRPSAWAQIGGYQDCIIEDHLTAMVVPATVNPGTGQRWKGVYTPDILTAGEGPSTWADFFSQQQRWAYGIFQVATKHSPRLMKRMTWHQRISFASLQFFYPSVGATWLIGNMLSALYLVFGVSSSRLNVEVWLFLFSSSLLFGLGISFWLRKFNLVEHERKSLSLTGMALNLFTTPVYLHAGWKQLTGQPLGYRVTAKGKLATGDTLRTFHLHLKWAAFASFCIIAGIVQHHDYPALYVWMSLTVVYSLLPIGVWQWIKVRSGVGVEDLEPADPALSPVMAPEMVLDLTTPAWAETEQVLARAPSPSDFVS